MSVRTLQEFIASSREKDASPEAFELESPHLLEVRLNGLVWAKAGAMVARKGAVKFTRQGVLEQGLGNLLKKAVSGEGMQLMKIEGEGASTWPMPASGSPCCGWPANPSSSTATTYWRWSRASRAASP